MKFTLFSIDSDDLSVTISMEENYQKMGAKYGSGSNLEAKQSEDKILKYENQQKGFEGRKSNRQQFIIIRSWSPSFSLIIYQRNYI